MTAKRNLLILLFLSSIILILLFAIYLINRSASPNTTLTYLGDQNVEYGVGSVIRSDNNKSSQLIGILDDISESSGNLFINFSVNSFHNKILLFPSKGSIILTLQSTRKVFATSNESQTKFLNNANDIKKDLSSLKGDVVILTVLQNNKANYGGVNHDVLACNDLLLSRISQEDYRNLNCTPYVFQISVYVKDIH